MLNRALVVITVCLVARSFFPIIVRKVILESRGSLVVQFTIVSLLRIVSIGRLVVLESLSLLVGVVPLSILVTPVSTE